MAETSGTIGTKLWSSPVGVVLSGLSNRRIGPGRWKNSFA
jgi:hypothetical protein